MRRKLRLVAVTAVIAVLATGAYAFTDANIIPASNAGFGAASVSGYDVSNITYALSSEFDNNIVGVDFDLDGDNAPTTVTVNFAGDTPDAPMYSSDDNECQITPSGTNTWHVHCDVSGEHPAGITQIKIGAAQ